MNYIISLNSRVEAKTAREARSKALADIKVREAAPLLLLPMNVYARLQEFHNKQKEHFIVLLLNTQNEIIKQEIVSIGTLNTSLVHPREVFQLAITEGCESIIIAHNHPSGFVEPSNADLEVTKRLVQAGELLGISLTDHVIIGKDSYYSLKEHNQL